MSRVPSLDTYTHAELKAVARIFARMRRKDGPTRGRRRRARRRQRGRVHREATRWLRELHQLNPWMRRDGLAAAEARDIVRAAQARSLGRG